MGPVDDEHGLEAPMIVPGGPGRFVVLGSTLIEAIEDRLGLNLHIKAVEMLSGALVALAGRFLAPGERVQLPGAAAAVLAVKGVRVPSLRIVLETASGKVP